MRLYRTLLHLYPKSFRHEYGGEMEAIHRERLHGAGAAMRVFIWCATVSETLVNAAAVHWELTMQDLRYARRSLRRSPGFAATAIVIIALGIGANTAVFSVADFMLIRPLPFRDPDRLVKVLERTPGYSAMELSPGNYRDWKRMNTVVEGMGTYTTISKNLIDGAVPARVDAGMVSADLFPVLGVAPVIGRGFTPDDDVAGAPGTLLLSYGFWKARFGGDPAVVGRQLTLDGSPYTVLGIMPPDFHFPDSEVSLWIPQRFGEDAYQDRTDNWLEAIARLRPGVTTAQARADFVRVAAILEQQFPRENERTSATVTSLRGDLSSQARFLLLGLWAAAFCMMLIVCANLANLLISRALGRRKEMAVRAAMGAGRERLVRQLATEGLVLAAAGGVLGVAVARAGVPLLTQLVPVTLPIAHAPSVDLRVMGFALLLTLAVGLAFGLLPVLRAGATADITDLGEGTRAVKGSESMRALLVTAEVAASVALLISTGLLLKALLHVQAIHPGFRTFGVVTLRTDLPRPRYEPTTARVAFYDRVLKNVRMLPGVASAAYISGLPILRGGGIWPVAVSGETSVRGAADTASLRFITPDYFKTLEIPLLRGRDMLESDTADRQTVAVVSESFVRRHWQDQDPLGRKFKIALAERTVVGVVGDVRVRGLERVSEPQVYLSYKQVPDGWLVGYFPNDLAVRSDGNAAALIPAIRAIIRNIDPQQPISDEQTIDQIVSTNTAARAVQLRVLVILAGLALLLAGTGIHGLLSFTVSQRAPEIGVRMALGASPRTIVAMISRQGAALVVVGSSVGCISAYAAGRAMQAVLAGVAPGDPLTFAAAIGFSAATAAVGTVIPAFRAARVDPVTAIKQ